MRRIHSALSSLAVAGMLSAASLVQADPANEKNNAGANTPGQSSQQQSPTNSSGRNSEQARPSDQSRQAAEGFVIIDEQLITLTANEPQNHFLRAKEYLMRNDHRAAAAEVRIAAAYLDMQASRKGEADQQELRSESTRLRKVADRLASGNWQREEGQGQGQQQGQAQGQGQERGQAQGRANPAGEQGQANKPGESAKPQEAATGDQAAHHHWLNHQFARAQRVLAKHFQEEAKNEIGKQKAIRAGEDLDAAATALSAAMVWSGKECSSQCTQAVADARRLSNELLEPQSQGQQGQAQAAGAGEQGKQPAAEQGKQDIANSNANNANEQAQPAGARLSGEETQAQSARAARIPQDAEKVVDELGKAIDDVSSKAKTDEPKQEEQSSSREQNTNNTSK